MQIDVGKYRGHDLSEVPTDYLEWATVHLALSDRMWDAVMAEHARRTNAERVEAQTPSQKFLARPVRAINRLMARIRLHVLGD